MSAILSRSDDFDASCNARWQTAAHVRYWDRPTIQRHRPPSKLMSAAGPEPKLALGPLMRLKRNASAGACAVRGDGVLMSAYSAQSPLGIDRAS